MPAQDLRKGGVKRGEEGDQKGETVPDFFSTLTIWASGSLDVKMWLDGPSSIFLHLEMEAGPPKVWGDISP